MKSPKVKKYDGGHEACLNGVFESGGILDAAAATNKAS